MAQQLVARIKRSSKYWGQTPPNVWFDIHVRGSDYYSLQGNNNQYRLIDVALGVRIDDNRVLDFTKGKILERIN